MERLGMAYAGEIRTEGLAEGSTDLHPDAPFAVYITGPQSDVQGPHTRWSKDSAV
jgi:hypothetical protein